MSREGRPELAALFAVTIATARGNQILVRERAFAGVQAREASLLACYTPAAPVLMGLGAGAGTQQKVYSQLEPPNDGTMNIPSAARAAGKGSSKTARSGGGAGKFSFLCGNICNALAR